MGIKDSGVPREEIWITTKLDNTWYTLVQYMRQREGPMANSGLAGTRRVEDGVTTSLQNLGIDYVDLYLMHWPSSTDPADPTERTHYKDWTFIDTW